MIWPGKSSLSEGRIIPKTPWLLINRRRPDGKPGEVSIPKLRADSTRPKEWLGIEKVRPIGFIGKDILALEKKITEPSEIIKQNQRFEISRGRLNQQWEQEQHPGINL